MVSSATKKPTMRKLELHWKILIGMTLGILFGFLMTQISWGKEFVADWIQPWGTIFVNLLKLIAIPLIMASLIKGISDLKDIYQFRNIGIRTITLYICTTIVAISIGLVIVNLLKPGDGISPETVDELTQTLASGEEVTSKLQEATAQKESGPLQLIVDMVPDNAISAMGNNALMLQVIFFTIFLGISMLLIGEERARPLKDFFDSLNDVVLKMVRSEE